MPDILRLVQEPNIASGETKGITLTRTVTRKGNKVRLVITSVRGDARPLKVSDVTMSIEKWHEFRDVILASANL